MKKVRSVTVVYEDNSAEEWKGEGTFQIHDTIVKGARPSQDLQLRYVSINVRVPVKP